MARLERRFGLDGLLSHGSERVLKCCDHELEHLDPSVGLGLARDNMPTRGRMVGLGEHVLGCLLVVGAVGEVASVLAGELPPLEGISLAGAKAA